MSGHSLSNLEANGISISFSLKILGVISSWASLRHTTWVFTERALSDLTSSTVPKFTVIRSDTSKETLILWQTKPKLRCFWKRIKVKAGEYALLLGIKLGIEADVLNNNSNNKSPWHAQRSPKPPHTSCVHQFLMFFTSQELKKHPDFVCDYAHHFFFILKELRTVCSSPAVSPTYYKNLVN